MDVHPIRKTCGQGTPSSSQTSQQCSACGTCTGTQGGPGSVQPRSPPYRSCTLLPGHPHRGSLSPWPQREAYGLPVEDGAVDDHVARMMSGAGQLVSNNPRCTLGYELGAPREAVQDSVEDIDVCIRGRNHLRSTQVRGLGYRRGWKMNDVVGICQRWARELGEFASSTHLRTAVDHLHPQFVVPDELRDCLDPACFLVSLVLLSKVARTYR